MTCSASLSDEAEPIIPLDLREKPRRLVNLDYKGFPTKVVRAHMTLTSSDVLVVGTRGHLLAFAKNTGKPFWKYQFKKSCWATGSGYVVTLVDGNNLFASCYGEIYCFDLLAGSLRWKDDLKGKGFGVVSFAVLGASTPVLPGSAVDSAQHQEERSNTIFERTFAKSRAGHSISTLKL